MVAFQLKNRNILLVWYFCLKVQLPKLLRDISPVQKAIVIKIPPNHG
jgi:hypothetical protein